MPLFGGAVGVRSFVAAGEEVPAGDESLVPGGVGTAFSIDGKRPRRPEITRAMGRDTGSDSNGGTGQKVMGRDTNFEPGSLAARTGEGERNGTGTVGRDRSDGTAQFFEGWTGQLGCPGCEAARGR
jgi:hypothetical protein